MAKVELQVEGKLYEGWKASSIVRSIESLSGSFSFDVADHWVGQALTWPIVEEDEAKVLVDGQTVVDGWVGHRSPSFTSTAKALSFQGNDRSVALVQCSAVLDHWTFRKKSVAAIVRKLAAPFGISVAVQSGLESLMAPDKVTVNPGDTAFSVIDKVAKAAGVMVVSDGAGGITITRALNARASQDLIEGVNMEAGGVDYDATERFSKYLVATQRPGDDNSYGNAARIRAEATDAGVRRTDRVTIVRPATALTVAQARKHADWTARIRAARASSATALVHGWEQSDGDLWPLNVLIYVQSPTLGIDGDMRISQAEHVKGLSGEFTTLRLVRPDAFTPDPTAKVKSI